MVDDLTQINWLQQLAKDYLKQQKRQRRFKIIFKTIIIALIVTGFFISPSSISSSSSKKDHVAVINLEGGIFSNSKNDAEHFIRSLKAAFKNKNSVAVMLNINSPGGSPVQADEMYQALIKYRKADPSKKVYAVCSDMCASAAYYVAAGADEIVANRSSLVGSIGVIYNGFGFTGAMEKVGVSRRMQTAGKYKGFLDPFSPQDEQGKAKLQTMLNIVHEEFKQSVIKGRGKRLKITSETFSGLFWTGKQAKEMGLIDSFGSIRDGFDGKPRVIYSSQESLFEKVNKQFGASIANTLLNKIGIGDSPLG